MRDALFDLRFDIGANFVERFHTAPDGGVIRVRLEQEFRDVACPSEEFASILRRHAKESRQESERYGLGQIGNHIHALAGFETI
jgi:hypothetical protein